MKQIICYMLMFTLIFLVGCSDPISIIKTKEEYLEIYNNEENFITLTGEITQFEYKYFENANYSHHSTILHIRCDEIKKYLSIDNDIQEFWVFSNSYLDLSVGDIITFTMCKKGLKGNAWLPIVGIIKEDNSLLNCEEGKENLILWVNQLQHK